MDLRELRFGVEIEMTGLTREEAAKVAASYFGSRTSHDGTYYDKHSARDSQGRKWTFMSDSSITGQVNRDGRIVNAGGRDYQVELVTPICRYEDIPTIQQLVERLRRAGALTNESCGLHIHVDAAAFDSRCLRNLVNIVAAKEDLLYKALRVPVRREYYCQKMNTAFLERLNLIRPSTREQVSQVWYTEQPDGATPITAHYHDSRYHALNLHSVFTKGTVEFRLFNSTVERTDQIKAYIQLCLAVSAQALNQRHAAHARTRSPNEKYTFRTWLLHLGMIGEEFKEARHCLLEHLDGNIAWKDPAQAERQKERLRRQQEAGVQAVEPPEQQEQQEAGEESPAFTMTMS